MRPQLPIAVALALSVAACATPRTPDLTLPQAFEAPAGQAGAVALDQWWTAFNEPELTTLVDQALAANTDVRTAAARLQEVRAQRNSAIFSLLPQGDATGSGRRTDTNQISGTDITFPGFSTGGVSEAYSANFNVSWELDLFGRSFAAARGANADVAAQRFAYEGARAAVAAQVADSFFQARGLAIQLADARETARIQRSLYELASKRARAGLAASSEPDRIAGDLAQADAQVAALEAELQAQRRALLILTGRPADPTASVSAPAAVGVLPPVPATIPGELLGRRPDVREAQLRVRSAAARQDIAERAFLPTFNLTPGIGWQRQEQPGFESETWNWSIGGSITQPILSIPRRLADLKAENARAEQAVINYERVVQTAFGEAEGALVRLDADRRRVTLLADGEARARRAFEAGRTGYARGLIDLNTVLSAEQSWRATRAQLTSAQVQALRRTVQAYRALGGGWNPQQPSPLAKAR
ncbi:TolC family protein [Phenylobacterium sp.]|jgi:NodT family efflux transporter outer membrane factor (OMF) lipoprotein|uniref:TolC family protein n=1 Tax=Phenylobacterium sp. TaxID=1871053 RepID=UPI002F953E66